MSRQYVNVFAWRGCMERTNTGETTMPSTTLVLNVTLSPRLSIGRFAASERFTSRMRPACHHGPEEGVHILSEEAEVMPGEPGDGVVRDGYPIQFEFGNPDVIKDAPPILG